MIKKKDILKELNSYNVEEIAGFIYDGIVSQEELQNESGGQYTPFLKYMVEDTLKKLKEEKTITEQVEDNVRENPVPTPPQVESSESPIEEERTLVSQEDFNVLESPQEISTNPTPSMNERTIEKSNKTMFSRPFSFKGRIRRTEYGITILIINAVLFLFTYVIGTSKYVNDGVVIAFLLFYFVSLWFQIAQSTKRCHDIGHSGWWQLIPFYVLWLLFDEGDGKMPNEYGESAK